jgi:hypothetical protein
MSYRRTHRILDLPFVQKSRFNGTIRAALQQTMRVQLRYSRQGKGLDNLPWEDNTRRKL